MVDLPYDLNEIIRPPPRLPPIKTGEPRAPVRVVVTGAASDIGQALALMVARGKAFGPDRSVEIVLVDTIKKMKLLREGLVTQIGMSMLKLVAGIFCTHNMIEAFTDADSIFLCSGVVPSLGFSRTDIITINALEFKKIGKCLENVVSRRAVGDKVQVLVVSEPPNTNMHVLLRFAPSLHPTCVMGLSRVDQNRGQTCIARRLDIACDKVRRLTVWGNKSRNIFFDLSATLIEICGKEIPARHAIKDDNWIKHKLTEVVLKRQADIERRRGTTLCLPVAAAAAQHMHDWALGTPHDDWASMIVTSDGSYSIEQGLCYSFPVRVSPQGTWDIVKDLVIDEFQRENLNVGQREIQDERYIAYDELKLIVKDTKAEVVAPWSFGSGPVIPCNVLKDIERNKVRYSTAPGEKNRGSTHFGINKANTGQTSGGKDQIKKKGKKKQSKT